MSTPKFQPGDKVSLRNDQGCVFPGKTILSVTQWEGYSDFRYFITPTDCPPAAGRSANSGGQMSTPPAVSRRGRKIILALTPLQVEALYQLCGQANADGDHESWLRGACAPPLRSAPAAKPWPLSTPPKPSPA